MDLARRYRAEGYWTDATLGPTVADGLAGRGRVAFEVHSGTRPWKGTFADVDRAARSLAISLRPGGIGPGDVVVVQLPNWVEAGDHLLGCRLPRCGGRPHRPLLRRQGGRVHPSGPPSPTVVVTADRFGHNDYLATYTELLAPTTGPAAGWWSATPPPPTSRPGPPLRLAARRPSRSPAPPTSTPTSPAIIAFTSGTTRDPKGVVHSHRTIGCETRQLDYMFPKGGPPQITGAPVGHFIGMLNAFLMPLLRDRPVHLVDVWDPGEVLRLMAEEGLGVGGGATYFLTSLLDHPDFTPGHLAMMPVRRPRRVGRPRGGHRAGHESRDQGVPLLRQHRASLDHRLPPRRSRGEAPDHRRPPPPGVELRLDEDGEIVSRGPDCCIGYTDAALTASAFDADGWYRTGDVGVLDADGYLTITDRISDVIIRGGENISAQEIEELLTSMEAVAEVAVVAEADARLGEHAAAVVTVGRERAAPTLDEVRKHLGEAGLARQKWPESIHVVGGVSPDAVGQGPEVPPPPAAGRGAARDC